MATRTLDDDGLLDRLASRFRRDGYDGVSLTDLQDATGLGRSSLYHHFPGGKPEMAAAVVEAIGQHFAEVVLATDPTAPAPQRLTMIADHLREFYDGGARRCVLDTMTIGHAPEQVVEALAGAMTAWIDALTAIAGDAGVPTELARRRATGVVAAIEGGLVVARVTGDRSAFEEALAHLADRLLTPVHQH